MVSASPVKSLILLMIISTISSSNSDIVLKRVTDYLLESRPSSTSMRALVEAGSMDGSFTTEEIENVFETLLVTYPQFVWKELIGQSYLQHPIYAYYLSIGKNNSFKKSKVLFTGAHHARELLTPTMVFKIYVEALHSLIHPTDDATYWRYNELIIVPIVNVDSHMAISKSFGTSEYENKKWRRKNMNDEDCKGEDSGIDLNRNYGFHYGEGNEDTSPCGETYRGKGAFSEPETLAIKKLVEKESGLISSAMNFHTYGNIWINPMNYMKERNTWPDRFDPIFINFYKSFSEEIKPITDASTGNAIETVGYSTNGEASDWMLGEHNIISFSPELGSKNSNAQTFHLPKNLIFEVIKENFGVIELFLKKNTFQPKDILFGFNNNHQFFIQLTNTGLATLFSPYIIIRTAYSSLLSSIKNAKARSRDGAEFIVKKTVTADKAVLEVDVINRLNEFVLTLEFDNPEIVMQKFSFDFEIVLAWGETVFVNTISYDGRRVSEFVLYSAIVLGLFIVLSSTALLVQQTLKSKKSRLNTPPTAPEVKKETFVINNGNEGSHVI